MSAKRCPSTASNTPSSCCLAFILLRQPDTYAWWHHDYTFTEGNSHCRHSTAQLQELISSPRPACHRATYLIYYYRTTTFRHLACGIVSLSMPITALLPDQTRPSMAREASRLPNCLQHCRIACHTSLPTSTNHPFQATAKPCPASPND